MGGLSDNEQYFDVSFEKLEISDASYQGIEFEECQFTDCDFSGVRFAGCKFINCEFLKCNLSLFSLPNSRLFGVTFVESKLVGVNWTLAEWPIYHVDFELKFVRCILNDSSFFGLTLNELVMDECKLHDVDFREGDFTGSVMTLCDFTNSLFMHTNLQNADFSDSVSYAIDVLENRIKGATFSRYEALNLLESLGIELVD
ncbi:pentapeptide repeat-containing protein [Vibrio salinus]|uniref:pentapeptide repeat-containing protein n=1 Tax=Vibrio salinus TaxID=2899784 RepID=UPI001E5E6E5A|nr:pentapeptide repeat-containing protein [Vibrio salinus]MCE0495458.1 pentapeptide repeat-containing protein [Vibrio salinus]